GCYSLSELKINYIWSLTVSPRGASSSARAWASPKAGVLPSFAPSLGRFTPVTGIEVDRIRIAQVHKERREGEEGAANACVRLLACEERVFQAITCARVTIRNSSDPGCPRTA